MKFTESGGPRYRKISLAGLPIPDGKPQAKTETDQENEETYVDALTLALRHDTSDIYIPIPGDEMALSVKRSITEEIWNNQPGFTPDQALDRPFGLCWQTGLVSYVKTSYREYDSLNPPAKPEPDYVEVVDEAGATHTFAILWRKPSGGTPGPYFLPIPSNRQEQEEFLNRLELVSGGSDKATWKFKFTRKFGMVLEFGMVSVSRSYEYKPGYNQNEYYGRLEKVTDRYGNTLEYSYDVAGSLVPNEIKATVKGTSGGIRKLLISKSAAQSIPGNGNGKVQRIERVTDPRGNYWNYTYSTESGNTIRRLLSVECFQSGGAGPHARKAYGYSAAGPEPEQGSTTTPATVYYHRISR